MLRWALWYPLLGRRRAAPPGSPAPRVGADLARIGDPVGPSRLAWIGHASFLGRLGRSNFLVDPVFSRRVGLVYRRHDLPGLEARGVPSLDALLVTHNHYDHLDEPSVAAVPANVRVVVPLGLGRWFRRRGRRDVVELGWWESAEAGDLKITLVPSRHWSRRRVLDTNRTLWGGFVIEGGGIAVYHAGDSAWFDGFAEIGRRFPGLAVAMLPIGGYEPEWFMAVNHLNPEEAGQAFLALGARRLVPMHWGSFQLTDEPLCEPAERVRAWWKRSGPTDGRQLCLLAVGETIELTE